MASLLHTSLNRYWSFASVRGSWERGEWTQGSEASQGGRDMLSPWVADEVKTANLQDKRLNERLAAVLSQLADRPTYSIPAACGARAEMVAAYRFCENEKASFETILEPHHDATRQRMADQPIVIIPQDTTEIEVTRPGQQVKGAGPLDGDSRRGAL